MCSTKRAQQRLVTAYRWPGVADAAAAEAAEVAVVAAPADAELLADAEAAAEWEAAALPGARAAGVRADRRLTLIDASCHGRVRQGRPGQYFPANFSCLW